MTEPVAGPLRTSRDGTKRQLVTTEFLILIIAGVAGASAVFGFALCCAGRARRLAAIESDKERLESILATVPGVGIHEDEHERVLEKFERGKRLRGRQSGVGAGLGLSLVKSFVELHGGDVELTSAPNEGTAIICRLPATPRANPGPEHEHDA